MEFGGVELPAEANPLTEGILFHVLQSAASSNMQQVQTATKQLQYWETTKGFYPLLQTAFIEKSLPLEVRYLAIIQLKNGIDRYWRKTSLNAVDKEDKALIRSRLLQSGLNEADHRLALQNALVTAKIVRFEFPNDWPQAISEVIEALRNSTSPNVNRLWLPRALLILLHIIKDLSTGRLIRTRTLLQNITPEIFHVLGRVYMEKVQKWQAFFQSADDDEGGALESIEQSLLAMKVIRRVVIAGYEFPNREKDVQEFWSIIKDHLSVFLALLQQQNLADPVRALIEKHLMQLSKFHLDMARTHPAAFAHLPHSMDLTRAYWSLAAQFGQEFGSKSADTSAKIGTDGDAEDDISIMERLSLKGLLLIRACIKMVFNQAHTFKYKTPEDKEEKKQSTELVKQDLLRDDFVRDIMQVVVTKYFVFRPNDLRKWEEEPDEWERQNDMEGDGDFEYSVRSCAEKLFLDLSIHFKALLVQPLLAVFYSVATPQNEDILFKDSVYTAVGLAAAVLHEHLDFDAFISQTLVPEVQKQQPGFNILRRRIAILLGQWITIKVGKQSQPLVFQIFQHLLNKDDQSNDLVVRVTAGRQFRRIADAWEFEVEAFLPYSPDVLGRLMALIEEVELTETKMALINTIETLVNRMEHHITPYADRIVSMLPPLWEQSGEEHMMKTNILALLSALFNAMKADSVPYHSLVIPIIKGALEPGSETQAYLLEDALDLWHSVVVQSPSPAPPELVAISSYLLPTFSLGTDTLERSFQIADSYMLLAPADMLSDNMRTQILAALASLLGTLRPEHNGYITNLVETMLRAAERLGGEQAVEVITGDLVRTDFFTKLMDGLRGAWEAHQKTGPNASRDSAVDGIIETDYFSVISRIGFASPRLLLSAIEAVEIQGFPGGVLQESLDQRMKWLLDEWFDHLENVGAPVREKLMALALTKLLETGKEWILLKLQHLMTMWTDVVTELTEGNADPSVDCLVWEQEAPQPSGPEAPDDVRRRDLVYSDPVHTVNLITFVRDHLQQAIAGCGGQDQFRDEWLVNVDKDVIQSFGGLGIM
ncbi:ARM repeat-containing protein [Saccharata proteae CBS 121410]|uniref:ARM repeat-containing protein n=1 Tax=Saccharata proteae CBS 121410 TaxID=1314787 RepID=A0A9P4I1C1_9PEZI|nr:ARM repeat-containing protein [Saccharata proteae CBS 121410]